MLARLSIALLWLLHFLPLALLSRIGETFGMLLYRVARERREVCLLNLVRCFPDHDEDAIIALAKGHFRALGRSVLERGLLWWSSRERIARLVRVRGREHLERELGRPLILLAPHFVALDAGWTRLSCELDMASMYANQKSPAFNRRLFDGRTRFGRQRLFSRQQGVRPALAALKEGRPFYYLPDQDYGPRDAIFLPFFGVPAATVTGMARLARISGARIVPCVTRMLPGGAGYELTCHPAWDDYPTEDIEADTLRMNRFIEGCARDMPEQYFWTHKRFKTRPPGEAKWY